MGNQRESRSPGPVRIVVLIIALCVMIYSARHLYLLYMEYREAGNEYSELSDSFTKPFSTYGTGAGEGTSSQEAAANAQGNDDVLSTADSMMAAQSRPDADSSAAAAGQDDSQKEWSPVKADTEPLKRKKRLLQLFQHDPGHHRHHL